MMKNLFPTIALLILSMFRVSAQQKSFREVWIFAPDPGNASFITQKSLLDDAAGLKERDIEVHEVLGLKANESVFKQYKASSRKFTFILFGKDGGEKLRSNKPVSLEKLYQTIDAMPMRRQEMKNKHGENTGKRSIWPCKLYVFERILSCRTWFGISLERSKNFSFYMSDEILK